MEYQFKLKMNERLFLRNPEETVLGRKILKHSVELIYKLGFEVFTFKKLAEEIGSTETGIYRYFENKHKLLVYLTSWYWSWMEYRMAFATTNVSNPIEKLEKAIKLVTENIVDDNATPYINEEILSRIIVEEFAKTLMTKEVDNENKEGFFLVYKRVINRIIEIIKEINPEYPYAKSLASNIVEGSLHQHFLKNHLKTITNLSEKECATDFYTDMAKKILL